MTKHPKEGERLRKIIDDFPNIKAWIARMEERPAVKRGMGVPPKREIADRAAAAQAILQR